jgi:uncharacterized protein (UPF0333 family)
MYQVIDIKGQVSTELLITIGVILVLFIPLLFLIYFKAGEANEQIMQVQAQVIAIRLSELSNSIGNAGGNATIMAEVYIPSSVKNITIASFETGSEITVHSVTSNGPTDIPGLVKFKMKSAEFEFQSPGLVRFDISNAEGTIEIKRLK